MKKLWNIATSTNLNTSNSTSTTIRSTSAIQRIIIIFTTVVSVTQIETTNASSSIPRSTNSRSYSNSIPSSTSSSTSSSSSNKNNNHNDNGNVNVNDVPPWNISPKIDSEGFITSSFNRIPGEWELEANIGGKYAELGTIDADNNGNTNADNNDNNNGNKYGSNHGGTRTSTTTTNKVMIRQVPGDGNCLFHSITVSMALVMNSTHIDMVGSSGNSNSNANSNNRHTNNEHPRRRNNKRGKQMKNAFFGNNYSKINTSSRSTSKSSSTSSTSSTSQNDTNNPNDNHNYDLKHLYQHSQYLREKAVDVLSNNPRRLLFLQGNEYLRARDLVNAAAAQYDLTGEKYCELMRKESYWGGGPEIVALCNYLKRPIHVYELSSDCDNSLEGGGDRGDSGDSHISHNSSSNGEDEEKEGKKMVESGRRSNNLRRYDLNGKKQLESPQFKLRRMACFGSPKFDRKEPLHILSADSRFPDIEPGKQLSSGNHFMALFPEDLIHAVNREKKRIRRRKKSAGVRGGGVGNNSGNGSGVNNDSVTGTGTGTGTTGLTSSIHGRESSNYSKRRKKKNRDVRSDSKHHQRQLGRHRDRTSYRLVSSNRRGKVMDRIWSRGVLGICQSFMRWMLCL